MKPRLIKMPRFIQRLYPERVWAFLKRKDAVFLTFDDGPIPELTPWVLDQLKHQNAKATFFCIGKNIEKNPKIFGRIIAEGHAVGNHTFNHLNGWQTETETYVENVLKCEETINSATKAIEVNNRKSNLVNRQSIFRPPYGKISSKQAKILQKQGFKIIMWDLLSYDFDATISEERCLQNVLQKIRPGSIVIFHDSLKAQKNLSYVLPEVLKFVSEKGWKCDSIQNTEF